MEERVVDSQAAYPSTKLQLSSRVDKEMSDGTWFAKQQLMKPMQLGQFDWSITQAVGTNIYEGTLPDVLGTPENGSLLTRTLRMYAFYKIAPCFRIQINATQFHQGQLICSFDPFGMSDSSPTIGIGDSYNIVSATGFPHVRIMASESEAVELKIPYIHPRSFLTTNNDSVYNTLGTFRISVLNALRAAEGSSSTVSVTLWVYAIDAEVHVPIFDHTPLLNAVEPTMDVVENLAQNGMGYFSKLTSGEISVTEALKSGVSYGQQLGGNLVKGFGQAKNMLGNFVTGNWGQALRDGQGLIDTLGDVLGFDYPSNPLSSPKNISPLENLAVGRGVSRSQRLAIDPYSMHMLEDDIASESLKAMDLKSVIKIPMLVAQFSLTTTDSREAELWETPVHPQICPYVGVFGDDSLQQPTYLSYVSNGFSYWNGGIKFDIEIIATHFHSGKLLFSYCPNGESNFSYDDAANSLPNAVLDIQQTSHLTFIVPYTSSTPMKSTIFLTDSEEAYQVDAIIGTLKCFVQNTLSAASNVSPSIDVNIYMSAADDFNLYVPKRPTIYNFAAPEVEATTGISIHDDRNESSPTAAVLSKDQDQSMPRKHFGENYHLIDILRRFSYDGVFFAPAQTFADVTPNVQDVYPQESILFENTFQSYLSYWSRIYSAWCGSIRYKFSTSEPRTSTKTLTAYHVPDLIPTALPITSGLSVADMNGFGAVKTNLSQDNTLELEVPYYSKFNMLLTRVGAAPGAYYRNGSVNILAYDAAEASTPTLIESYVAAGEDFRYVYLRPPPVFNGGNGVFEGTNVFITPPPA